MAISHADHDHPNTPAGRAKCRKAMAVQPHDASTGTTPVAKPPKAGHWVAVEPIGERRRTPRNSTKPKASTRNLKRPNTKLKGIGDLADVPAMLAYAVRLAWDDPTLEVVVGDSFNESEANIIIKGPAAHVTCMWKVANPHGIHAMRIRPVNTSVCAGDATTAQQAVDIAAGREPIPTRG